MISKNKLRATKEDKSPTPEKGKLLIRVLSGLVIITVTIGMIFAGKLVFTAFVALLAGISLYEWSRMVLTKDKNHIFITSSVLAMAAIIIVAVVNTAMFAPLLALGLAFLLRVHAGFRGIDEGLTRLFGGFLYIVTTLSFLTLLGNYAGKMVPGPHGAFVSLLFDPLQLKWILVALFVVVWSSDSVAYVFGRILGGPKLAPAISPKKTWAGLLGSMFGAGAALTLASCLFTHYFEPVFAFPPSYMFFAFGAFLGVIGQAGDLVISFFKRAYSLKDTGALIPGHGGVLDRIDALMLVIPFYYLGFTLVF